MTTPLSDERIDELAYRLKGTVTNPRDWWCEAAKRAWWNQRVMEMEATNGDADE